MKKAFTLVLRYFVILIAGTLVGTLFYTFYLDVLNFVAGQDLDIWSIDIIMQSMFHVAIVMCFLIFPFLSYYRIKHSGGIGQNVAYIILFFLTVLLIFPFILRMKNTYLEKYPPVSRIAHLSGGYFRPSADGEKVYYFTRDFYSNPINGDDTTTVIIDTSENGIVEINKIKDTPDFPLYQETEPYKEILVKKAFGRLQVFEDGIFHLLVDKAEIAFDKGVTFYLGFSSIMLLFASIYAFTSLFKWKLLSTFVLILNSVLIVLLYNIYNSPICMNLRNRLGNNRLMYWLSNYIDEPPFMFVCVIISVIFIIAGFITGIVRNRKKR